MDPSVTEALARLGGVARRADLVRECGRTAVDAALVDGTLLRLGHGSYGSGATGAAAAAAASLRGVLSHRTAALTWGWAVRTLPERPDVLVPRNRNVAAVRAAGVTLHRGDLEGIVGSRTSRERTLVDCLRSLPLDEALAVADSALRDGFPRSVLLQLAAGVRGAGAARVRRVAAVADGRAANPFESSLRAICLEVPGLRVVPQVTVPGLGTPDLLDEHLRLVLEADSFTWHGGREALHRDANRYNAFVAAGWTVLRFSWEEVMFHPLRVAALLRTVVDRRAEVPQPGSVTARVRAAG